MQIGGGDDRNSPATFEVTNQRELSLLGRKVGRTVLNLWFADPSSPGRQRIVSYAVRSCPIANRTASWKRWSTKRFPAVMLS